MTAGYRDSGQRCSVRESFEDFLSPTGSAKTNAEFYAWLAETLTRSGKRQEALTAARKSLQLDSRNSFAHLVIADIYNQTYGKWDGASEDSTWTNLMEAVKYDSSDGNAWIEVLVEAIRRQWKRINRIQSRFISEDQWGKG